MTGGLPEAVVGLDIGTSGVKALALALDGRVLAGHEVAYRELQERSRALYPTTLPPTLS